MRYSLNIVALGALASTAMASPLYANTTTISKTKTTFTTVCPLTSIYTEGEKTYTTVYTTTSTITSCAGGCNKNAPAPTGIVCHNDIPGGLGCNPAHQGSCPQAYYDNPSGYANAYASACSTAAKATATPSTVGSNITCQNDIPGGLGCNPAHPGSCPLAYTINPSAYASAYSAKCSPTNSAHASATTSAGSIDITCQNDIPGGLGCNPAHPGSCPSAYSANPSAYASAYSAKCSPSASTATPTGTAGIICNNDIAGGLGCNPAHPGSCPSAYSANPSAYASAYSAKCSPTASSAPAATTSSTSVDITCDNSIPGGLGCNPAHPGSCPPAYSANPSAYASAYSAKCSTKASPTSPPSTSEITCNNAIAGGLGCNPAHPGSCPSAYSANPSAYASAYAAKCSPSTSVSGSTTTPVVSVPASDITCNNAIPGGLGCNPAHAGSCPSAYTANPSAYASAYAAKCSPTTILGSPATTAPAQGSSAGHEVVTVYVTVNTCAAATTPIAAPKTSTSVSSAPVSSASADCKTTYDQCRVAPNTNRSTCASQYAACLGCNPFSSNGTLTTCTPTSSVPATSSSKTCPTNLAGAYQYPHLIIPVDSSDVNKAAGTQYNGKVTSAVSTIFNFDIPSSYTGTCSLVFLFPEQKNLETSSYTFSGPGSIDFKQLSSVATQSTSFANKSGVKTDFGVKTVTPGSSTVVSTFACPAGQTISYELSSVGGTALEFFQDYNPSPIGLYITSC